MPRRIGGFMNRLFFTAFSLLAGSAPAFAKPPLVQYILKCDGESMAAGTKSPMTMTYRIDEKDRSVETWDGAEFHRWGKKGDLEVAPDMVFFITAEATRGRPQKSFNIDRKTGKISEATTLLVGNGDQDTILFDGICAVVDKPEEVKVKF